MIAQIILTILLMGILVYAWAEYRRSPVIGLIGVFAASGGLYLVWFAACQQLADIAGIGRGVNLIIYTWVVISLLVALNLHLKLRAQMELITALARDRDCQCAHRRRKARAAFRVDAVRVVDGNPANRCRLFLPAVKCYMRPRRCSSPRREPVLSNSLDFPVGWLPDRCSQWQSRHWWDGRSACRRRWLGFASSWWASCLAPW